MLVFLNEKDICKDTELEAINKLPHPYTLRITICFLLILQ